MKSRRKNGELFLDFRKKREAVKDNNTCENRIELYLSFMRYLLGCTVTEKIYAYLIALPFSFWRMLRTKKEFEKSMFKRYVTEFVLRKKKHSEHPIPYSKIDEGCIYHATAVQNLESIFIEGLKAVNHDFVFFTDKLSFYEYKKKTWYGKEVALLKIDVNKAIKNGHSFYRTDCSEIVSDYIEPECIEVFHKFSDGIYFDEIAGKFI